MQKTLIARVSSVLVAEKSLEGLVRQLLEMLELVTNMESTYLTHVESDKNVQHVLFSHNSKKCRSLRDSLFPGRTPSVDGHYRKTAV